MDFDSNKLFSFTDENHNFGSLAFVLFLLSCSSVSVLKCLTCGNEYFASRFRCELSVLGRVSSDFTYRIFILTRNEENSFSSLHKVLLGT